jgi:hypothetical protein
MEFRASFCDPFKKDIIELGTIDKDKIMAKFESIDWVDYLKRVETAGENEIYYSPSLEIENKTNKNGLVVTAIDGAEWYIFFKRPKRVKKIFGLYEKLNENYLTDVTGQTAQDVRDCLMALINNDLQSLENKIK